MMNKTSIKLSDFIPFEQAENHKRLTELGAELLCKTKIETSKKGDTLKYTFKIKNRNLFSIKANDNNFEIKPALWRIDEYKSEVESANDNIKNVIASAKVCKNCSYVCGGGARFTLDGNEHYKCLFSGFNYKNPSADDVDTICQLITLENDARMK